MIVVVSNDAFKNGNGGHDDEDFSLGLYFSQGPWLNGETTGKTPFSFFLTKKKEEEKIQTEIFAEVVQELFACVNQMN